MAAPLALDIAPHDDLPGWRRGEEALESLAYIDGFTEQEKRAVELLIVEEVRPLSPFPFCSAVHMAASSSPVSMLKCSEMLQLKQSTKRPQDYLKEMPPMANFKLEVSPLTSLHYPGRLADTTH